MAKTKRTKKPISMTKAVKEFILEKMCEGMDVSEICHRYPDKVPARAHVYRHSLKDPEWAEDVNQAYSVLLMHRMDDLHNICGMTAAEAYPDVKDWRQAEAALKRRVDEAKFVLGKMAPILSKRFDKATKVEHSGEVETSLQIVNYYAPEEPQDK